MPEAKKPLTLNVQGVNGYGDEGGRLSLNMQTEEGMVSLVLKDEAARAVWETLEAIEATRRTNGYLQPSIKP